MEVMKMFAIVPMALMGLLAIIAPKHGTDSRPDFSRRPDKA